MNHTANSTAGGCRDCKHWKIHGKDAVWGDCLRLVNSSLDPLLYDLYVTGHFGSNAGIKIDVETHPDFGCVLWEG